MHVTWVLAVAATASGILASYAAAPVARQPFFHRTSGGMQVAQAPLNRLQKDAASGRVTAGSCASIIPGEVFPEAIPTYVGWNNLFSEVARLGLNHPLANVGQIDRDEFAQMRQRNDQLQAEMGRSKARHFSSEPRVRDADLANVVLEARDDLIRTLSHGAFAVVENAAQAALKKPFDVPAPGTLVKPQGLQESLCRVTVRGRDYPHLMPERLLWKLYLVSRADSAAKFRVGTATYDPRHIAAVQRTLQAPPEHILTVLEVASRVQAEIVALPNEVESDRLGDQIAMTARNELVRTLPKEVWEAVKFDAFRIRNGMVTTFPAR